MPKQKKGLKRSNDLGMKELLNSLFQETDQVKLNARVLDLLSAGDLKMAEIIAIKMPKDVREALTSPAKERLEFVDMFRRTKSGNRTKDIPFSRGRIVASGPKYMSIVQEAMIDEANCLDDGWYSDEILEFIKNTDDTDDWKKPTYIVLNEKDDVVGYIALTMNERNDVFWESTCNVESQKTYNLEYYTMPNFRKKGFMKDALSVFLEAISKGALQYQSNAVCEREIEMIDYPMSLIYAEVRKANLASIKTVESLGKFELLKDFCRKPDTLIYTMRL